MPLYGEAERKAFRFAALQNGLWDIYWGCCLIITSLYEMLRSALGRAWYALLIGVVLFIRYLGDFPLPTQET